MTLSGQSDWLLSAADESRSNKRGSGVPNSGIPISVTRWARRGSNGSCLRPNSKVTMRLGRTHFPLDKYGLSALAGRMTMRASIVSR